MKRRAFLAQTLFLSSLPALTSGKRLNYTKSKMNSIQLLRHATLVVQIGDIKILVDPMLSAKEALDPVQNAPNSLRIPMTDLPFDSHGLNSLLANIDVVLITHIHRDHWDAAAQSLLDKSKPIFCQPADVEKIKDQGFRNVTVVEDTFTFKGITIHRTKGQHGTGEIGKKMGDVSGFVLTSGKQRIYIAGDTIWCDDVVLAINKFKPTVTVVNAGAAQFLTGGPITMTPEDVVNVVKHTDGDVIAVHMDCVNHCLVRRADLKAFLESQNLSDNVIIPSDGELVRLS